MKCSLGKDLLEILSGGYSLVEITKHVEGCQDCQEFLEDLFKEYKEIGISSLSITIHPPGGIECIEEFLRALYISIASYLERIQHVKNRMNIEMQESQESYLDLLSRTIKLLGDIYKLKEKEDWGRWKRAIKELLFIYNTLERKWGSTTFHFFFGKTIRDIREEWNKALEEAPK